MAQNLEVKTSDISKLTAPEFNLAIGDQVNAVNKILVDGGFPLSTFENKEAMNHFILANESSFATGGSANAITISRTAAFQHLKVNRHLHGQIFTFLPTASNTGETTIKVDDLAVKLLTNPDGTALGVGFIANQTYCSVRFNADGDRYELINRSLASSNFTYTDIEVNFNADNGYKITRKADGTIDRLEQWGLVITVEGQTNYTFPIAFSSTPAGFGAGRSPNSNALNGNNDGMFPISATQYTVFDDQDGSWVAWLAWGK